MAYDSAIVVGKSALEKAEKEFGKNDTTVASVLNLLGGCYYIQANCAEAESIYNRALTIRMESLGPDHPDVGKSLMNLGIIYWRQGKYKEAEPLSRRGLAILEKTLGPHHVLVARALCSLANIYGRQGKYLEAESLFKRAQTITEETLAPDHSQLLMILNGLGDIYYQLGKYTEAEVVFNEELSLAEKAHGPDHPYVALALNNLAAVYYNQGKYTEAEPLYRRALAIKEKALDPDHVDLSYTLEGLGVLYQTQGKYLEAEPLLERSVYTFEKALGPDHPQLVRPLNNLADLYLKQSKYGKAELLYKQALAISEKALGLNHPEVARSLNNLACLYGDQGKYVEAELLNKRALDIWERAFGPDHPKVAWSLNDLVTLYSHQGKYDEAESLYKRALVISEKVLGPNHPFTGDVFHEIALLFKDKKEFVNSRKAEKRACAIRRQNFRDGSAVLSEKEALTYSRFVRDEAHQYVSILLDSQDTSANCQEQIAEAVFSTKGQVSDGIFARHRTRVYEKDLDLKPLSDSLRYAMFRLSRLYVQGPGEKAPQLYRAELDSVSREKELLEAELARRSADFRRELELWEVDAERVSAVLPPTSALVEYMRFDRLTNGRETEPHYLLVIVDDEGEIFVSDLGSSEEIDSLVSLHRSHLQRMAKRGGSASLDDIKEYEKISAQLYERIWKPVESNLDGAELVFVAPDGALNLVSFAGLAGGSGKYLIEKHPIHYLSSGRDLIRLEAEFEPGSGLFALGDPDFDASVSARLSSEVAFTQTEETDSSFFNYRLRNVRSGCEALNEITVLPLPGTRKEIEKISEAWKKRNNEPCCLFLGAEATEDNFKQNAPGSKVIHLATHGYYAESDCRPDLPKSKFGMSESFVGENPLLLSGLFLAGANLHGEGADSLGIEDGILTAEEVTGMELEGTKWVVLSACESGLGEVKAGEGVYGLRRAFQMAGARTVISALWPVSDKTTAEMMAYLYSFGEDNLALAMQSLAKKKIKELRRRNQPDHPYLWAPFIALGDWR